jgi:hypothetical protein
MTLPARWQEIKKDGAKSVASRFLQSRIGGAHRKSGNAFLTLANTGPLLPLDCKM